MSPATATGQQERIAAAEEQLEEARGELREAEGQLAELEGEIEGLELEQRRLSTEIRRKHASGIREGIRELRVERRQARAEKEDLEEERPALRNIVSRREEAVRKARAKLALAQGQELEQQARELGEELFEALEAVEAKAAELEELRAEQDRTISTLRHSLDHKGPMPSPVLSAAGAEPAKGFLRELREQVQRWRARREHG